MRPARPLLLAAFTACLLSTVAAQAPAQAQTPPQAPQTPPAPTAEQAKAADSLRRSLAAHGSDRKEGTVLSVRYAGEARNGAQSLAVMPPFEAYPAEVRIVIDRPGRTLHFTRGAWISGDFDFHLTTVLRDGKGFTLDRGGRTWRDTPNEPSDLERFLPGRLIERVLADPSRITDLEDEAGSGIDRFAHTGPDGRRRTVAVDEATRRLAWQQIDLPAFASQYGNDRVRVAYGRYREVAGVQVPEHVTVSNISDAHGPVDSVFRLTQAAAASDLTPADLELPKDARADDPSFRQPFTVESLGERVHLVMNPSEGPGPWFHNVMIVEFADHLLVAEASVGSAATEKVLAKAAEIAPGKPVRFLVQSHHHGDHIGGIRPYVAEGARIIAPTGVTPVIEALAKVTPRGEPDRLAKAPKSPVVEELAGERVLKDQANEVIIFNLGNDPHAGGLLVTYLPKQRVLFQSDLVNAGAYPNNSSTRNFVRWLKEKGLQVDVIAGSHGRILRKAEVEALLAGS
ncbi:MAG TPA: MBL fold metallo-hydrolase [Azospirillaceae bacterium]|nr:MBL fold metallo-hydrolase [Azospirillaceae bacterium]